MRQRENVFIHATAEVDDEAIIGPGTKIWNWTKVREGVRIGRNCVISQCVYIDFNVSIGDACKIQNGVSVYHGMTIGDRVFIGPNATFTNDRFPRAESIDWEVSTTVIEEGASIGANATIRCGIRLGTYCMIAAGAVVTRDVPPFALMLGVPARHIDYVDQCGRPLRHVMDGPPPAPELLFTSTREKK